MAIPNVIYAPGGGAGNIAGAIKLYVPKKASMLFNTASKVIKSGAVKKLKVSGVEWTATAVPPCTEDVGFGRDYSRWPVGTAVSPVTLRAQPTHILGVLRLGNAASLAKLPTQDASRLVETQLTARLKQMTMHLARGIFGGAGVPFAVVNWTSTAADGEGVYDFMDVTMFKEGASYDLVLGTLSGGNQKVVTVRCKQIERMAISTNSANVAGRVTFINDVKDPATNAVIALPAVTAATTDRFYQRGTYPGFGFGPVPVAVPSGDVLNSFTDLAGTASLHGQTPSTLPGWAGHTQTVATAYNQELPSAFAARIEAASGESPTHYFCSPQLLRAHGASFQTIGAVFGLTAGNSSATPRGIDANVDKYGDASGFTLNGKPVIADIMCNASTLVAHNDDHVWLAEYSEIQALQQSGDAQLVDRDLVSTSYQLDGQYQLVTDMRSTVGQISGFTGL
jgi:hypothetical protein